MNRIHRSAFRGGQTREMVERVKADPCRVIVCSSEKAKKLYLSMGVSLKQIHVITRAGFEAYLRKRIEAIRKKGQLELL